MGETIIVILTALSSGLIATLITIYWQRRNQSKNEKVSIFTILMSKRYDIASEESVNALNMIDVVFYKSEKVRSAWKQFLDATNLPDSPTRSQTINDRHLKLLEVIAEDIGYREVRWDDIKQYYYPVGLSSLRQDEAVLRRVQIDAGLAQINESKKNEESSQTDTNNQMATQVLIEAMKNPDGLLKLMEVAEKAQKFNRGTDPKK